MNLNPAVDSIPSCYNRRPKPNFTVPPTPETPAHVCTYDLARAQEPCPHGRSAERTPRAPSPWRKLRAPRLVRAGHDCTRARHPSRHPWPIAAAGAHASISPKMSPIPPLRHRAPASPDGAVACRAMAHVACMCTIEAHAGARGSLARVCRALGPRRLHLEARSTVVWRRVTISPPSMTAARMLARLSVIGTSSLKEITTPAPETCVARHNQQTLSFVSYTIHSIDPRMHRCSRMPRTHIGGGLAHGRGSP